MGSTYKAVVWTDIDKVEVVEKPVPEPGPGKVLLRTRAAGICGTDLHMLAGKHPEARPPLVPGHEFAGEVAAAGKEVDSTLIGARVGADSYIGCGKCKYCLTKRQQLCENGPCEMGINIDGGWAEYVVVPVENLYLLPDNVEYSWAGAGCILNCPPAAIEQIRVDPGDSVLIIGDGPSSLIMVQLARLKGVSRIIIAGHRERRLSLALDLGADQAIDTHSQDLVGTVRSLASAPQVVIDAVGKSETLAMALQVAARCGRVHLFGLPEGPLSNLPMDTLLFKELTLTSSTGAPALWPVTMDLISRGYLKVAPLISHRFPIEEAPQALEFMKPNSSEVIKVIFEMN